jgi:hypothetical protein
LFSAAAKIEAALAANPKLAPVIAPVEAVVEKVAQFAGRHWPKPPPLPPLKTKSPPPIRPHRNFPGR